MAKRYPPEGLQQPYDDLAGPRFWVPAVSAQRPYVGPVFAVYLRYSELFPEKPDAAERLWQLLAEMPIINAIGVFARSTIFSPYICRLSSESGDPGAAARAVRSNGLMEKAEALFSSFVA
jgi:hypothetical protein